MTATHGVSSTDRSAIGIVITRCPDCEGRLRWIADVKEPMEIRKILMQVQSRAPPGGGSGGEHHPDANTTFTLAG